MKIICAVVIMLLMATILTLGVVWAAHGHPWLLMVSALGFLLAFGKIGCLGH